MSEGSIYLITCRDNGKRYVGQTICNIAERFKQHVRSAKRNSKCIFHNAIRKYGADSFQIELLCKAPVCALTNMEGYWAEQLETYIWDSPGGYNSIWCSDTPSLGLTPTDETRIKMSVAGRNRPPRSAEVRANMSQAAKNRSAQARINIAEATAKSNKIRSA